MALYGLLPSLFFTKKPTANLVKWQSVLGKTTLVGGG
jgi:hypothetical protein